MTSRHVTGLWAREKGDHRRDFAGVARSTEWDAGASLMTGEEVRVLSDGAVDVELADQSNLDRLGPKSRTAHGVTRELASCPSGATLRPTPWPERPERSATHRLPLADAPAAYGMFQRKADGAVKIMLKPWS